ncbi:MAG: asparagine synthase (glutamine-hydrolyzing) [Acidobacteriota bacterium]
MCGIIGEIALAGAIDAVAFDRRRDLLSHRGPDDAGTWLSPTAAVALGNRRLALCDPSPAGRQPMASQDGALQVTFNGEIYNFRELRRQLEALGHRFRSACDTEVLVHGWEAWGEGLLAKLEGMFAFGLWDARRGRLVLARDRFGIKPLYYYRDDRRFAFASEARALVAHPEIAAEPDAGALCDFLVYRFVPSPKCIWRSLAKLPPAHALTFEPAGGSLRLWCHWQPPSRSMEAAATSVEVGELLADAVASHGTADVAVGSLLSGGMDSAAMVASAASRGISLPTFSLGFSDWPASEHGAAAAVAAGLGLSHRQWLLGPESLALVERMATVFDEPLADISTIPTFAVCALAGGHVKGVLSGEGSDELFGGYDWHHRLAARESPPDLVSFYGEAMAMGSFAGDELATLIHPRHREAIPADPHWFYRACAEAVADRPLLERLRWLDLRSFMGELVLTKVDRASMAASLEARVPFLDQRFFDAVFRLPAEKLWRRGEQKPLLAELLRRLLPARPPARPKQGFVGPDRYYRVGGRWLDLLRRSALVRDRWFSAGGLATLLERGGPWRLWKLLVLELWYRRWVAP